MSCSLQHGNCRDNLNRYRLSELQEIARACNIDIRLLRTKASLCAAIENALQSRQGSEHKNGDFRAELETRQMLRRDIARVYHEILETPKDSAEEQALQVVLDGLRDELGDLNQTLTDDDEQKRKPYCVASFALSGGDLDVEDPQIITISHSDGNLHRRHCYLLQDLLRWFDSSAPIRDQNRRRVYMLPLSGTFVYENAVNALASGLHADGVRHWVSYAGPDQVMVGNDMQRIYQLAPLETIMRSIRNSALRRDAMPPPPR